MSDTDEKILKALEDLRADVTAIKTDMTALQSDVTAVKHGQQNQEKRLEALHADVKNQGKRLTALEAGQIALDLKVEAIHDYQQKAHTEIMGHLVETTEMSGRDHKALEKRVARIEKHLDLPPVK
jgi:predicted  nucleic acid-binding Zn-ribbon protein